MAIVDSETSCVMHVDSKAHTSENAKKQIETIQCVVSGSMPVTEDEEAQNHFRDFDTQQTSSAISNVHVVVNDFHGERKVCNISDDSLSVNDLDQCEKSLQETLTERDYLDDDDDDSDWEPFQKHLVMKKWYCTNCTMVNFEDVDYCDACGEHKESEIFSNAGLIFHDAQKRPEIPSENMGIYQEEAKYSEFCTLTSNGINICTAVGFDERMLLHSEASMKSHPHPERPDRLRAIASRLAAAGIYPGKCFPIPAREVTNEELQMIHAEDLIEAVELTRSMPCSYFTSDTYANPHSASAARIAAGLCADLATAIMSEKAKNGFALVRPPGHHAGIKQPMGFCLHNNAAVAALSAQAAGAKRVLIVDWDVHHGNGTQEIFEGNKTVLYLSLHRHEGGLFYPGTGAAEEVGVMGAEGYCVNIPWKCAGVGDNDYIFAFQHIVLPIASKFAPDFTIVSAGFDAARGDPLGRCDVTPAGYAQMTHMLGNLSDGKLLVILEGGYNLHSISSSSVAVINVLLGETPTDNVDNVIPSRAGILTALEVLKIQMKFWPSLESNYLHIQSNWEVLRSQHKEKRAKRRRVMVPTWWKWGSKRWLYNLFWGEGGLTVHHQSRRP